MDHTVAAAGGFAQTLDLQGVSFIAPGEDLMEEKQEVNELAAGKEESKDDDVGQKVHTSAEPSTMSSAESIAADVPSVAEQIKLADILVEAFNAPDVNQLNV